MNRGFEMSKPIPFNTAYNTAGQYRKVIGGFKYVSVLTDGEFNPQNNNRVSNPVNLCPDRDNDSHCYLEFDNGERLQLNGEVRNFVLPADAKYYDLFNCYAGISSCGMDSPETGYGNMFIILSMQPVSLEIPKLDPSFEVNDVLCAAGSDVRYWAGIKQMTAFDVRVIPYIPQHKCSKLQIMASAETPGDFSDSRVYVYTDGDDTGVLSTSITWGNRAALPVQYLMTTISALAGARYYFHIINNNFMNDRHFWLRAWWTRS